MKPKATAFILLLVLCAILVSTSAWVNDNSHGEVHVTGRNTRGEPLGNSREEYYHDGLVNSHGRALLRDDLGKLDDQILAPNSAAKDGSTSKKSSGNRVPLLSILLYTTLMALASGLGAAPFLWFGRLSDYWSGMANAIAVGVMFTASFELLHEGGPYSPGLTVLGMCIGGLFIKFSQDHLSKYEDCTFEDLQGADARKAILIVGVMAAHAFGEGSGVGVSFSGERGWSQGLLVTIAIGLHNVPEGMAVAGVMMAKGSTPQKAVYWTLLCALPQAVVAVPSFLFVETFSALLPLALGFAAGCMIWIAFAELIPDALAAADHSHVATAATLSAAWLQGLSMFIERLEEPGGQLASPIQADLWSVAWFVALLTPALIIPIIVAAISSKLIPAAPVTMGAAVGAAGFVAASDIVGLMLGGKEAHMSSLVTLSFAIAGAASAFIVWPSICGTKEGSDGGGHDGRSGAVAPTGLPWGGHVEGMPVKHVEHHGGDARKQFDTGTGTPDQLVENGGSWNSNFRMSPPTSKVASMNDFVGVANGHGHMPPQPCNPKSDLLGGASSINMTDQVYPSAMLTAALLICQGIPLGMTLTKAVASSSDGGGSHLMLPLALIGVPVGLACVGLGRAISGTGWKVAGILAAAFAFVTASMLAGSLATLPLGMGDSGNLSFDPTGWTAAVQAILSGALFTAALLFLWPAVCEYKAKRARVGVALGMIVAVVPWLLSSVLCWFTPYCLRR